MVQGKILIDGFNKACKNIAAIFNRVGNYSMSAISFLPTVKWNLPHLSYILHKTEPLDAEFKTVECSGTGYLLLI